MASSKFIWQEMSKPVVSVSPTAPLRDAAVAMRAARIRHLPVTDDGALVGILSDRDIPADPGQLCVADVMSKGVNTCRQNDCLGDVADVMIAERINGLPVVDEAGHVIGIITSTDLLKYLRRTLRQGTGEAFERLVLNLNDIGDCES